MESLLSFPARVKADPPVLPIQEWEWPEVVCGLDSLIETYGAQLVLQYIGEDAADDLDSAGYILQRFGRDRVLAVIRNLAARHGQELS